MFKAFPKLNQKGASAWAVFGIILAVFVLVGGLIGVYFTSIHKEKFSDEEIATAKEVAQNELGQALALGPNYKFDQRFAAIQSLGYDGPENDDTDYIFEKKDEDSNYYVLLRLKPHETFDNMTRVLVSVFDKKNGALITEVENIINWQK